MDSTLDSFFTYSMWPWISITMLICRGDWRKKMKRDRTVRGRNLKSTELTGINPFFATDGAAENN